MANDDTTRVRYLAGLSLGPPGFFTGLAVLEKHCRVTEFGNDVARSYAVRHLARFPVHPSRLLPNQWGSG